MRCSQVLVYDLRSPKTPIKTFAAHNTSVSSMVFKHKVDKKAVAQVMSVVKSRTKLSQHKSTPSLRTVLEETKDNTEPTSVHDKMDSVLSSLKTPTPTITIMGDFNMPQLGAWEEVEVDLLCQRAERREAQEAEQGHQTTSG